MSSQQTIKFTIRQDGTVLEDVKGVSRNECINITKPFEEQLGVLKSRINKPEYYVTLQSSQNKTTEEKSSIAHTNVDGVSS
tara:strand:- start:622 stop:864 length:243 start_codon:yes stop_codon:yes gene_type:complete